MNDSTHYEPIQKVWFRERFDTRVVLPNNSRELLTLALASVAALPKNYKLKDYGCAHYQAKKNTYVTLAGLAISIAVYTGIILAWSFL